MDSDRDTNPRLVGRLNSGVHGGLVLAVAAFYFAAAKLGLTMAFVAEQVTAVWPPSGIALAVVLVFGRRAWPGIALGAFLANVTTGAPIAAAAGIAVGNTLEAVGGAWLLRRFVGLDTSLHRLRDVLGLAILAAGLSTMVSATVGVASLCSAKVQPWGSYGRLWWVWWLGDATSDLVVSPLILTLLTSRWGPWPPRRIVEAAALLTGLVGVTLGVFGGPGGIANGLVYSVFPFIIWAALRFGPLGSAAVTSFSSAIAIWGTIRGFGPFAREHAHESLMLIQLFMGVVAITGMFLAAAVAESRRAERRASAQYAAARILAASRTREAALPPLLDCVRRELEWDVAAFWIAREQEDELRLVEFCSDPSCRIPRFEEETRGGGLERGEGLPGRVWATAQPAWLVDIREDEGSPRIAAAVEEGLRGALAVPVLLGGEVFGVMEFLGRGNRQPDEDVLEMTTAIGRQIGQFIERRSAEEALARSRETLSLAQEASQSGTFVWDIRNGEGTWSDSGEHLYGLPPGGFEGKFANWKQAVHPEDRERAGADVVAAVERQRPLDTEFRTIRPDGEVRWIAARGRVFLDEQGAPTRLVGINIDITGRKQDGEALRRSEERYRAFIQQSSEGIWRCEVTRPIPTDMPEAEQVEEMYRHVYLGECNDAMARMYGFSSASDIVGARLDDLLPRSDPHNLEYLRRFIRGGYRLENGESHEVDRRGDAKHFMNNLVGIVEDGCLVRAWGTQRDVTEQKRMERALREADRRKDEFLAMLAHELRNPLSAINSAAELARHPQLSAEDRLWSEEVIRRQLQHLGRLIDDLLDISRITRGKVELRNEPLDVGAIINQAVDAVRPRIAERGQHLDLSVVPDVLPVMGDATRVEQIIVNLLTNAAKYTEAGGRIWLAAGQAGAEIIIRVRDTGIGIPPEKISEVFDLFVQGDRSLARSEGGLGIGLTLVKRLAELHGGSVTASSEGPGKGSEFVVRLPLARASIVQVSRSVT
jgi:PAS domain S-box-containing protein